MKSALMRLLDVRPVSATLEEDHNIIDRENSVELIMDIQMKNN